MRVHTATFLAVCMSSFGAQQVAAQQTQQAASSARSPAELRAADERLYGRAVARELGVPGRELEVLAGWVSHVSEVPVLLFVADRAGVTPDVVGSLRRSGQSWQRISLRFGLGPATFRVPVGVEPARGVLLRPVREFARPAGEWHQIALTDQEIIALVNLRVLSNQLGVPPDVLIAELRGVSPDFIGAFARVARARTAAQPPPN